MLTVINSLGWVPPSGPFGVLIWNREYKEEVLVALNNEIDFNLICNQDKRDRSEWKHIDSQ